MKRFVLTLYLAGKFPELPISEGAFEAAKKHFRVLADLLLMEERFDSVAASFVALEELLVARLLQFERVGFVDGNHQMFVRRDANRMLMNVLTSARGYIDQLPKIVGRLFGADDERAVRCTSLLSQAYDKRVGYRVFEALRNHVQHSGFPAHSISYGTHMIGDYPKLIATKSFQILTNPKTLAEDKKLKSAVLAELLAMGEWVDLQPLLKQYIAGIAEAHASFRIEAATCGLTAEEALQSLVDAYVAAFPEVKAKPAMYAACIDGDEWLDKVILDSGSYQYLQYLVSINYHLQHADKDFLIGSVAKDA